MFKWLSEAFIIAFVFYVFGSDRVDASTGCGEFYIQKTPLQEIILDLSNPHTLARDSSEGFPMSTDSDTEFQFRMGRRIFTLTASHTNLEIQGDIVKRIAVVVPVNTMGEGKGLAHILLRQAFPNIEALTDWRNDDRLADGVTVSVEDVILANTMIASPNHFPVGLVKNAGADSDPQLAMVLFVAEHRLLPLLQSLKETHELKISKSSQRFSSKNNKRETYSSSAQELLLEDFIRLDDKNFRAKIRLYRTEFTAAFQVEPATNVFRIHYRVSSISDADDIFKDISSRYAKFSGRTYSRAYRYDQNWKPIISHNSAGFECEIEGRFNSDVPERYLSRLDPADGGMVFSISICKTDASARHAFSDLIEALADIHPIFMQLASLEVKPPKPTSSRLGRLINWIPRVWFGRAYVPTEVEEARFKYMSYALWHAGVHLARYWNHDLIGAYEAMLQGRFVPDFAVALIQAIERVKRHDIAAIIGALSSSHSTFSEKFVDGVIEVSARLAARRLSSIPNPMQFIDTYLSRPAVMDAELYRLVGSKKFKTLDVSRHAIASSNIEEDLDDDMFAQGYVSTDELALNRHVEKKCRLMVYIDGKFHVLSGEIYEQVGGFRNGIIIREQNTGELVIVPQWLTNKNKILLQR